MIKVTGISGIKRINVGNFKIPTRIKITEETPKRKEYVCLTHNDFTQRTCMHCEQLKPDLGKNY